MAQRIGETISEAMIEVISVPGGDEFQVITRHPPEGRNLTSECLGIRYGAHSAVATAVVASVRVLANAPAHRSTSDQ
jgi:hypothetical protein